MADNIYLLETRLSKAQQDALLAVRDVARAKGLTVFLVGGAVRDLIGGTAVRDLDVVVQGNALKLRKDMENAGGVITGGMEAGQAMFLRFPGGVRMEIGSTLAVSYPKPGKAVVKPATILEDLRRRDFTANAMALSLNEGSYGLLMDPLNGVADIENRELRLVSNYGFIEDPVRMIRAARYMARLGWRMDEKTQARYETGKAEGYISAMDGFHRGYETEEIFHEEDPLRVIRRLEEEGWMQHLAPSLSAAKANVAELERLRESQAQLQMQGVVANAAAASFPLLTAKMAAAEVQALKKSFPRQGFVDEIEKIEARGKEFAGQLSGKGAALPSQSYKLIVAAEPEAVLWTAHTTKSGALQAKFRSFYTEWPQARQRIPYLQMQEMRITSELPRYEELVSKVVFELMDGKLGTVEEMKAFLEPFSPPAPPPPVSLRRPRAPKKEAKPSKSRKKSVADPEMDGVPDDGAAGEAAEDRRETVVAPGADAASDRAPQSEKAAKTGRGDEVKAEGRELASAGRDAASAGLDSAPAGGESASPVKSASRSREAQAASGGKTVKGAPAQQAAASSSLVAKNGSDLKDGTAAKSGSSGKNGSDPKGGGVVKGAGVAEGKVAGTKATGGKPPAPSRAVTSGPKKLASKAAAVRKTGERKAGPVKKATPARKAAPPVRERTKVAKPVAHKGPKGSPAKKAGVAKTSAKSAAGRAGGMASSSKTTSSKATSSAGKKAAQKRRR